ncbi:transcription factor STE12 [Capronia coronata CBS 617.96]|uniref:Transcription factor STE12 n=1 Tax=Capronia coronata CBS 617.96 TaxID=1182541 RepID=W9XJR3_9EURO|nr:transcription factor STE12 [Capronia coronata CBS 617.96]EXJ80418.1 transcription factor STE12 [Capronia coronata CBS 617.96]
MYHPSSGAPMAHPQKPETFMLSNEAQQSLPQDAQVALQQVDNLKYFLISAPVDWSPESLIRRFLLPTGEYVSCVLWNNLFHISGTDIVRCLSFRFQAFGRPVKNPKKFEEGIFSDLRNLKSGTDASLEEPKSPFLDFLYKNNCIRTQKKQKVFYWYSVPHDRLFLDALERDLKREKMNQEATTKAVAEPALSFEFDSSQSLFEQLTKAQQASSSSFATANGTIPYSQPASPVLRAADSMPPPQMVPPPMPRSQEQQQSVYTSMAMSNPIQTTSMPREQDYSQIAYDRNGVAYDRAQLRHASMPAYMEYSPAPSFVSSHFEDYSTRGLSYEPITPPQHAMPVGTEPAYIANEDTGLYSAIPEMQPMQAYNPMASLPPSTMAGPTYASAPRAFPPGNVYSVIEGSPTYKARRRRSSIPSSIMNAVAANAVAQVTHGMKTHVPQRPSDLRRSMSSSVLPIAEGDESAGQSPPGLAHSYASSLINRDHLTDVSRHSTPLHGLEEDAAHSFSMDHGGDPMAGYGGDDMQVHSLQASPAVRLERPGPVRRARSATMMELGVPYKSHSCPIPSCGRLFKRLEHLKRHVRTHTQERPYVCPYCNKAFSRSDNLAQHRRTHESQQDGQPAHMNSEEELDNDENDFGSMEELSSPDEVTRPTSVSGMVAMSMPPPSTLVMQTMSHSMMAPSQLVQPSMLQNL